MSGINETGSLNRVVIPRNRMARKLMITAIGRWIRKFTINDLPFTIDD
jgi:hypothetical protein